MGNRLNMPRPGSGDKPSRVLPAPAALDLIRPPRGLELSREERLIWRRWAPRAIAKRTLTAQTVPGFRFLVGLEVERRQMKATIDTDGIKVVRMYVGKDGQEHIVSITPHPLLPAYSKLQQRVEVNLAKFGLSAFGKAEPELPAALPKNPWAKIAK